MTGSGLIVPLAEPGHRHVMHQIVQFSRALHDAGLAVHPAGLVEQVSRPSHLPLKSRVRRSAVWTQAPREATMGCFAVGAAYLFSSPVRVREVV